MNKTMTRLVAVGIMAAALASMQSAALAQNKQGYWELRDVLAQVYKHNPSLDMARQQYYSAQELYPQARAGWLPTVNAETSIYATRVESSNFGTADGATTKDVTLSVDQPIWRGGITTAEMARAQSLITAEEYALTQAEQLIFLRAAQAYMNVIRDRSLLELFKKNEEILFNELKSTWARMEIGDITNTDVQQAKARLAAAKSSRVQARNNLDLSAAEFEEVAGIKPPDKMMVPYLSFAFPQTLEEKFAMAEAQNPEIARAEFEHKASTHDVEAVERERMPQVSGFASMNRQYDPQPGVVDRYENDMIGVRATLALYKGGATSSRIREARYKAKRREFQIQETKQQIRQEITSHYRSYQAALAEVENRKQEIEALELALKGVREEAKLGQRSVLDVLDADQETINAKAALVRASHNEVMSQLTLAQSLGLLQARLLGLR